MTIFAAWDSKSKWKEGEERRGGRRRRRKTDEREATATWDTSCFYKMGGDNYARELNIGQRSGKEEFCENHMMLNGSHWGWTMPVASQVQMLLRASLFSKPCPFTTLFGAGRDFHLASRGDLYARAYAWTKYETSGSVTAIEAQLRKSFDPWKFNKTF